MQLDCFSADWGSPPAPCLHVARPCTGWGGPGPSLPEGSCRLGCVTVLTLCLLCSSLSLPPPSPCPSDFRTVVETAATARKSPPGCRAQLVLQPPGTPLPLWVPSRTTAQPEGQGSSGPARWICLQLYTSVFEDREDGSRAGSSRQLGPGCLWPGDKPSLPRQT